MKTMKKLTCTAVAACMALSTTVVAGAAYVPEQFEKFVIPGLQVIDCTNDADSQAWFSTRTEYVPEQFEKFVIPGLHVIDCTNDADSQAWFQSNADGVESYSLNAAYLFSDQLVGTNSNPTATKNCQYMSQASRIKIYAEGYNNAMIGVQLQKKSGSTWQDVDGMSMTLTAQNSYQQVLESAEQLPAGSYRVRAYPADAAGTPVNCKVAVRPLDY